MGVVKPKIRCCDTAVRYSIRGLFFLLGPAAVTHTFVRHRWVLVTILRRGRRKGKVALQEARWRDWRHVGIASGAYSVLCLVEHGW